MRIATTGIMVVFLLTGLGAWAAECEVSPAMSAGTHYRPIDQQAVDISEGLRVAGKVLEAGSCRPIANAKIAHWQMDRSGRYVDRLRAYLYSNKDGSYAFNTEWPGAWLPHIHFIVTAPGYRELTTQWVGDEVVKSIQFDIVLEPLE